MKIQKGMYVRYTRGAINGYVPPRIAKIINKNNDLLKLDNNNEILESDIIGKPSFNLINLIEVGDYVNGTFVLDFETLATGEKAVIVDGLINYGWGQGVTPVSEVKDVVTKEQFNACKYVVERDK